MSDLASTSDLSPAPRRAPLVTVISIFVLFALFAAVVYYVYVPRRTGVYSGNGVHTDEQRLKTLADLRAKEAQAASSYGWVNQQAGVVQLPLDRAMELTVQQYAKKQ